MPAPTKYPDWATETDNSVEPPGGKKAVGWVPAEQPPSGWFNWWQNIVGQWTRWLDTLTVEHEAEITTLQADVAALEDAHTTLAADAARTSIANTFTQPQVINASATEPDTPLLTTSQLPSGYSNSANPWKLELAFPTDATSAVAFYVGQGAKRFAITYNARWHLPTQLWRHLDVARDAYALVCRDSKFVVSRVPAGADAWADWPETAAGGGDLVVNGLLQVGWDINIAGAAGEYNFATPRSRSDWTIPLACSSGETFLQPDGSYKAGPDGASWSLKVPAGTRLSNIYVLVNHASAASSIAAAVRRNKGVIGIIEASVWPTQEFVASSPLNPASGVQLLTIPCDGHVVDGNWEYSVRWTRAHANDTIGRIVLGEFLEKGIRNYG